MITLPLNLEYQIARRLPSDINEHLEFLKSQGLNIPLKNITGLGNSTGEAKAMWMLKKFSEGYNDMYFVDDALPNVRAVKEVLDQLTYTKIAADDAELMKSNEEVFSRIPTFIYVG